MKRIVTSNFGSFGDIHPSIAIALELRARGHVRVVATSEVYREKMDALGLELRAVRPVMPSPDKPDEVGRMVEGVMGQKDGPEKVLQLFLPHMRGIYDDLDAATVAADLLLTHPLPLVGPIVAQKKKLRWVSSVLPPASLLSVYDPIVPPQWPALYKLMRLSPLVGRAVMGLATLQLDRMMKPVYDLRAELGLPRGAQPILAGQHSPTLVLALFSQVPAEPQPDWPAHTRVTGFPFYDRRDYFGERETPRELLKFLDDGPPPILFTLGSSAIWVAKDLPRL